MAEDEIVKHSKKIYKTWFNKELSIWHKISEFLIEMMIIIFAVTISIWFHNLSEHRHQQKEVKQFLTGLKADLTQDIKEMNDDKQSFINQKVIFSYLARLKKNEIPNEDTVNKYYNWIFNSTTLNPNDGRFQGFKSSGKIGTIENNNLQNDIMDLYEEDIPSLLMSTSGYNTFKQEFVELIFEDTKRLTDSTGNMIDVLRSDEVFNFAKSLSSPVQVIERYDRCIRQMNKIICEIDKEPN